MVNGLGERLAERRKSRNLTQKQVANAIGVSPVLISYFERGERTPTLEILLKLAAFYRCSLDYLIYGKGKLRPLWIDTSLLSDEEWEMLQVLLKSLTEKRV